MLKKQFNVLFYFKKISTGIVLSLVAVTIIVIYSAEVSLAEIFVSETIPNYHIDSNLLDLYGLFIENISGEKTMPTIKTENKEESETVEVNEESESVAVVGLNDVVYLQDDEHLSQQQDETLPDISVFDNPENLRDLDYLRSNFYVADTNTGMTLQDFNVDAFLSADLKTTINEGEPQILIFHTHSGEMYADSDENDIYEGVVGLGRELANILKERYGINSIHDVNRYDFVNLMPDRNGSYERMERNIIKILEENPSIEIAIDIHRDGVLNENTKFITEVNGKPTAQIMFVNGLSKIYQNGRLTELTGLPNPNLADNLAFSFQMQLMSKSMYPSLSRRLYLKAYRYSLHMLPKSLLVEVGAQTNTKQEALNAMDPLANILYEVIFK